MSLFRKKSKSCLGIDIGTSSIKVIQLRRSEGRYKLETYGELQTYGYLERLNDPFQTKSLKMLESQVIEMTRRILKEAGVNTKRAVISIPVFSSFAAVIDMPLMLKKELPQALSFEAKRHIPIPLSEVNVDWKIIDEVETGLSKTGKKNLKKFRILLVAVPKEVINKYLRIARTLGLKLSALELESFGYVRSLMGNDKSTACVLDLGARSSSIIIVDKGFTQTSHSLDMAGTELTRALSHGMGVSFKRAEAYKKERGLDHKEIAGKEIKDLLLVIIDKINFEIEKTINAYQKETKRKVTKLILSGGSGNLAGLKEYFEEKLKIDVRVGNPWTRIIYPPFLEPILKDIAPRFAVAIGLAMRET